MEARPTSVDSAKIIGICLVRNEDIFIQRAVLNALDFCDQILIADHQSTDRTPDIVLALANAHPKILYRRIDHPRESHDLIKEFIGTKTWIFGVDGDEIYDPVGLQRLRSELLAGTFDPYWILKSNVLHCIQLDERSQIAEGFLAPPSRSIAKLVNFFAISDWLDCELERLHGGRRIFKKGFSEDVNLRFGDMRSWEESYFRCLHLCFLQRSSNDQPLFGKPLTRLNLEEKKSLRLGSRTTRFTQWLRQLIPGSHRSGWKRDEYMKGPRVTKDITPFFPTSVLPNTAPSKPL